VVLCLMVVINVGDLTVTMSSFTIKTMHLFVVVLLAPGIELLYPLVLSKFTYIMVKYLCLSRI
jgi:hypothetical protein